MCPTTLTAKKIEDILDVAFPLKVSTAEPSIPFEDWQRRTQAFQGSSDARTHCIQHAGRSLLSLGMSQLILRLLS